METFHVLSNAFIAPLYITKLENNCKKGLIKLGETTKPTFSNLTQKFSILSWKQSEKS